MNENEKAAARLLLAIYAQVRRGLAFLPSSCKRSIDSPATGFVTIHEALLAALRGMEERMADGSRTRELLWVHCAEGKQVLEELEDRNQIEAGLKWLHSVWNQPVPLEQFLPESLQSKLATDLDVPKDQAGACRTMERLVVRNLDQAQARATECMDCLKNLEAIHGAGDLTTLKIIEQVVRQLKKAKEAWQNRGSSS